MNQLTDAIKQRIRYHMGYANISPMIAMINGVARPQQTSFLIDVALENVLADTIPYVMRIVQQMDSIEDEIGEARAYLAVEKVDTIVLRGAERGYTHTDLLEREYVRWSNRLADILGCPKYPFAARFNGSSTGGGVNARIVG